MSDGWGLSLDFLCPVSKHGRLFQINIIPLDLHIVKGDVFSSIKIIVLNITLQLWWDYKEAK